jgi:hypothetical protein
VNRPDLLGESRLRTTMMCVNDPLALTHARVSRHQEFVSEG